MVTEQDYDPRGGILCLDFVNTVDRMTHRPWVDGLRDYPGLVAWSLAAGTLPGSPGGKGLLERARAAPAEARAVLGRSKELREAIFRLFCAIAEEKTPADGDLELLNAELARALSRCRIRAVGSSFTWDWSASASELDLPLWPIARSAAELLTSDERANVKRCAGETCLWLFLDRSKNHGRRWCDMKVCGNRAKVRRHRRRAARG